jgi:hypothetical protein
MMQAFLPFLAFLFVLSFPSTNLQFFDGLPFSALPEFAVLALAAPFLLFPELRVRQAEFWRQWKIRPAYLWLVLAAVLLIKGILFASGEYAGFAGCYRSQAEPTGITHEDLPFRECERSYENLFGRFSATRMDKTIWFGEGGWNLVFLNTNRYDYPEWDAGNILRSRMPIQAQWTGDPDVGPGESIRIEYAGEGKVTWGDVRVVLPPAYSEKAVVEISPPVAAAPLEIEFSFDDGSRTGQDPQAWGPRASIKVEGVENGKAVPLIGRNPGAGWRMLAILADGLILLWVAACLPALWMAVRRDLVILVLFTAVIGACTRIPLPGIVCQIGITLALTAVLLTHFLIRPLRPVPIYTCIMAAAFAILVVWSSGFTQVILRSAGNDPLQYESQAYSILATGSLRGGESVFYFQPMYRFVLFVEHVLFGDANTFSSVPPLAVFWGAIAWLFDGTRKASLPLWKRVVLILTLIFLIFLGGTYVAGTIREGLSEYPAWILMLIVLPLLLTEQAGIRTILGFMALALSVTIRVNHLPAALWLSAVSAVRIGRRRWRLLVIALVGSAAVILLPLIHNVFYGQAWVLFTKGSGSSALLAIPPDMWLSFFRGDPAAADAVAAQWNALFLNVWMPDAQRPIIAAMAGLLVCWAAGCIYSIVRGYWREWPALILPVFFLAPHLLYNVTGYYPKYIFAAYLCMGAVLPAVWMRAWTAEKKASLE